MAATVKHFPGIGGATANTDDEPVSLTRTPEQLLSEDLPPFRAAIAAGVPLVMASHAVYPSLDPDAIASQSRYVLHRLLRQRLGFRGVIVTDSLEAKAVTARAGPALAAVRSVRAGADLILTTGAGSHLRALRALVAEAQRSPAFRKRVEESAARVLALKKELGSARAALTRTLRTCCRVLLLALLARAPPPRRRRPSRCSWSATAARSSATTRRCRPTR